MSITATYQIVFTLTLCCIFVSPGCNRAQDETVDVSGKKLVDVLARYPKIDRLIVDVSKPVAMKCELRGDDSVDLQGLFGRGWVDENPTKWTSFGHIETYYANGKDVWTLLYTGEDVALLRVDRDSKEHFRGFDWATVSSSLERLSKASACQDLTE
jgi:hypothetical protein